MAENPTQNGARPERRVEARRRCSGTTKAGKPCASTALLEETGTCMAHAPEQFRASRGFGGPENGAKGGRPRNPKAVEVLRQKLEENFDPWWQVLEDARRAQRGVVVGDGETARVEFFDDHPTRLKAFREMMDRAVGRPTQFHDVTTREDESEVDREIRELLAQMDQRAHVNGNGKVPH